MHRQIGTFIAAALGLMFSHANAQPPLRTETRTMSFEACQEVIRDTAGRLGVAPINIVETNIMRMVRFPASGGSVLVTCSRPDNKMAITMSPH